MQTATTITIDLDDVLRSETVRSAIAVVGADTMLVITGEGPGPGWSKDYDASDYAQMMASEDIAASGADESAEMLNPDDGRICVGRRVRSDEGEDEIELDWTDESVVRIECPGIEEAVWHAAEVAEMARAVIDRHGPRSDRKAWADLIRAIRDAAKALDEIDPDDFAG